MSVSSTAGLSSTLFNVGVDPNWLADTFTNIQNEANQGRPAGYAGQFRRRRQHQLVSGFKHQHANNFALISQNSVVNASSLIAQIASQNLQKANAQKLQDAFDALTATQQQVAAKNVLDPFVYLPDGSMIDTNNNIMTMSDGTQYDITTGAKYVDPANIIQMANGAYLNTKTNVLTMADGTRIDTVTGLKISVTA